MAIDTDVAEAIKAYNYDVFPPADGREAVTKFPELLKVGQPAPDFTATLLEDGSTVHLSDYYKKGPVLLEFGSLT